MAGCATFSYDLALIPVALMLTIAALLWLRIDAAEELIPEKRLSLFLNRLRLR